MAMNVLIKIFSFGFINISIIEDRQCTCNVLLRRVLVTVIAMQTQQ